MEAMKNISLYQNLIYASYAIMALGLGLSIFFFFYFKIPDVFRIMTGRAKRETIQRISEENFKTGKLRIDPVSGAAKHSEKLRAHTGSIAAVHITADAPEPETAILEQPQKESSVLLQQEPETTVLQQEEPVCNIRFDMVETTIVIHTEETVN